MMKRTGLIDADFIKYLVAYDIEKMFKGGLKPDVVIPQGTLNQLIEKRIKQIAENTHPIAKNHFFLFSGKTRDNYRSQIAAVKKYKGTRVYSEKYLNEGEYRNYVEDYIQEYYPFHKENDLEADDLCIMGHTDKTFIYSNDKDLTMSPGMHYDIKQKMFYHTSEDEGFRILMAQTLSGDSVDNIMGMDGVGKVISKRMIAGCDDKQEIIDTVLTAYTKKYGFKDGLDRFTEMYTLVNLKTDRGDWTKDKYKEFFSKLKRLTDEGDEDFHI